MWTLRRLLALPRTDRQLLAAAGLFVFAARVSLRLLPYAFVRRVAARLSHAVKYPRFPAARIAWAVAVASRRVPGGKNCLAQALAAHVLLARHGLASRLRLGVARTPDGRLDAHAWVEAERDVLVGALGRARYTPFPTTAGDGP